MKIGTRKDRELAAYYRDMNFYLFLNKLKVKVFPKQQLGKISRMSWYAGR